MRALAVSALLLLAGPAPAALAGVDLKTLRPYGVAGNDRAQIAVAGDVNGDGRPDVATSLQNDPTDPRANGISDIAVVTFGGGPADPARADFAGWIVTHLEEPRLFENGSGSTGGGIAGIGDWDGDGLADVAIGAAGAGANERANSGSVYVVLGRPAAGRIDVRSAPGVIRINGPKSGSEIGRVIAPAGDVDGDGRPDVVIALPGEQAVIVRGGLPAGTTIDLANPPAGVTLPITGLEGSPTARGTGDPNAAAFLPVGDLDGDGRGELLVGLPTQEPDPNRRGAAVVLRGAPAGGALDGKAPLVRITGARYHFGFGQTLASVPDTDGDGQVEWLIGAPVPSGIFGVGGELPSGAFVVFSRARGTVQAGGKRQPVVTVDPSGQGESAGEAVAGVPDQTGDGVPDLLIGVPDASPRCRSRAGTIALVPGRRTPGTVRIARTAPRVDGPDVGAGVGSTIAPSAGELFLGTLPFQNSAQRNLWQVPLAGLAAPSPALPARDDCLRVTLPKRTRAQLLRDGVVHARVRSNAGDDRPHRLVLELDVSNQKRVAEGPKRTIRLRATGTRRLTLRIPAKGLAILRAGGLAGVSITAQQRVGSGNRTSEGAYNGDGYFFRR